MMLQQVIVIYIDAVQRDAGWDGCSDRQKAEECRWKSAVRQGRSLGGSGLEPGLFQQIGSGNSITMKVGASGSIARGNIFAFLQDGAYNTIEGSVQGNSNQAVVVQSGSGNFTTFSQSGSFNVIGVNQ